MRHWSLPLLGSISCLHSSLLPVPTELKIKTLYSMPSSMPVLSSTSLTTTSASQGHPEARRPPPLRRSIHNLWREINGTLCSSKTSGGPLSHPATSPGQAMHEKYLLPAPHCTRSISVLYPSAGPRCRIM